MSRRVFLLTVLLIAVLVVAVVLTGEQSANREPSLPTSARALAVDSQPRPAGRAAPLPDPEWIATATEMLGQSATDRQCGPYRLLTDTPVSLWKPLCDNVVTGVEQIYVERLGVAPIGDPSGAIILFSERIAFRAFVKTHTGLAPGYAAFSRASRGIVAATLGGSPDTLAATLAHELAHLLHRRALGPDLPPWLSEGLADAVGDTATTAGFRPIRDPRDAQPIAKRLLAAIDSGEHRPLVELLSLPRRRFDRGVRSFDYEQSALLVRFLLVDPERSPAFRDLLGNLAGGTDYQPRLLEAALHESLDTLNTDFESWLLTLVESK